MRTRKKIPLSAGASLMGNFLSAIVLILLILPVWFVLYVVGFFIPFLAIVSTRFPPFTLHTLQLAWLLLSGATFLGIIMRASSEHIILEADYFLYKKLMNTKNKEGKSREKYTKIPYSSILQCEVCASYIKISTEDEENYKFTRFDYGEMDDFIAVIEEKGLKNVIIYC